MMGKIHLGGPFLSFDPPWKVLFGVLFQMGGPSWKPQVEFLWIYPLIVHSGKLHKGGPAKLHKGGPSGKLHKRGPTKLHKGGSYVFQTSQGGSCKTAQVPQ